MIFHEILLIQNNFRELTIERILDHRETSMQYETATGNFVTAQAANDDVKCILLKTYEN